MILSKSSAIVSIRGARKEGATHGRTAESDAVDGYFLQFELPIGLITLCGANTESARAVSDISQCIDSTPLRKVINSTRLAYALCVCYEASAGTWADSCLDGQS